MKKLLIIIFLFVLVSGLCAGQDGKKEVNVDKSISALIFETNYQFVEYESDKSNPGCFRAHGIKFIDGDTFIVKKGNKNIKYHLISIDCPELDQPFGKEAKTFASNFVHNKVINISGFHTNELKQPIACLTLFERPGLKTKRIKIEKNAPPPKIKEGTVMYSIITNHAELMHIYTNYTVRGILLKKGLAWIKQRPLYIDPRLDVIQAEAKKKKIGLWKDKNPIPPWEWRKKEVFNSFVKTKKQFYKKIYEIFERVYKRKYKNIDEKECKEKRLEELKPEKNKLFDEFLKLASEGKTIEAQKIWNKIIPEGTDPQSIVKDPLCLEYELDKVSFKLYKKGMYDEANWVRKKMRSLRRYYPPYPDAYLYPEEKKAIEQLKKEGKWPK